VCRCECVFPSPPPAAAEAPKCEKKKTLLGCSAASALRFHNSDGDTNRAFAAAARLAGGGNASSLCAGLLFADVGANVGEGDMLGSAIPRLCGKEALFGAHFFEPSPATFARLSRALGADPRLRGHHVGVGAREGRLRFFLPKDAGDGFQGGTFADISPTNAFFRGKDSFVSVNVTSLDAVFLAGGRPITFLKVDVEGFEEAVFFGAAGLFREGLVRVIVYECHGTYNEEKWPYPANVRLLEYFGFDNWLMSGGKLYRIDEEAVEAEWWKRDSGRESNCMAVSRKWAQSEEYISELCKTMA
jgi:FkbM family methyltransferase